MYVAQCNGATFKTFLGGGLFLSMTADAVASNFLGSIAQDVVERWDNTNTDNLRQALESCLLLTDSKCNVPDRLQKEFGVTQLTLGQYLLKKVAQGRRRGFCGPYCSHGLKTGTRALTKSLLSRVTTVSPW
jgi:hypothetical protein